jgi:hypothetical protein
MVYTMSNVMIDPMNDSSLWRAVEPDNSTPSSAVTVSEDVVDYGWGADAASLIFDVSPVAQDHRVRRNLGAAIDLTAYDEVRCFVNADRATNGSATTPYFIEIRLGNASLSTDDPLNTWRCSIPVGAARRWEQVRFDIRTLPPAVRSACSVVEFRVKDNRSFSLHIDALMAVREEMLIDADNALVQLLNNKVVINGAPVGAVVFFPEHPPTITEPLIVITNIGISPIPQRRSNTSTPSNFTDTGSLLQGPVCGFDLQYRIVVQAATRSDKAKILESIYAQLTMRPYIDVLGTHYTLDIGERPSDNPVETVAADLLPMYVTIKSQMRPFAPVPAVKPYHDFNVEVALP